MRRRQIAWWVLGTLALFGCGKSTDDTELVVTVWTDLSVPNEMDAIRIRVLGKEITDHPFQLTASKESGKYPIPIQLGLVPAGEKNQTLSITAIGSYKGTEMVWQQAKLPFIPGQAHELTLYLARACQGVTCSSSPGMTCDKGVCSRPITVQTSELPSYTEGRAPIAPDAGVRADAAAHEAGREVGSPDAFRAQEVNRPDGNVVIRTDLGIPPLGDAAPDLSPDSLPDAFLPDTSLVPDSSRDTSDTRLPDTRMSDTSMPDTSRPSIDTMIVNRDTYVCIPETDQQLCLRLGTTCGPLDRTDNCGTYRYAFCGTCSDAGVDTLPPDACVAETDQQMCTRLGGACGASLGGYDLCGQYRFIIACEGCQPDAGGPDTCVSETDLQMCNRYDVWCGEVRGYDNCGVTRFVASCGGCHLDAGTADGSNDAEADL